VNSVGGCCAVLCYAVLCCAVLCCAVLCCAVLVLVCFCACSGVWLRSMHPTTKVVAFVAKDAPTPETLAVLVSAAAAASTAVLESSLAFPRPAYFHQVFRVQEVKAGKDKAIADGATASAGTPSPAEGAGTSTRLLVSAAGASLPCLMLRSVGLFFPSQMPQGPQRKRSSALHLQVPVPCI
jgi:hypothetical protein